MEERMEENVRCFTFKGWIEQAEEDREDGRKRSV